jgi:aminoglycoside/choline kinase family phosphotransferase
MTRINIARSPEELTPQWLTAALRESGVIREANVTAVRIESIGAGSGFLGQLARVHVQYDRAESAGPASLIAKMPTLDPGGREVCRIFQFYEREIRFYEEIAESVQVRVPGCYYTAMDIEADDYLLLLEDITDARIGNEVAGCTAEEAERVIRSIAQFHATWWESPKLNEIGWMPYFNAPVQQLAENAYNQAWEPFLRMFGDKLSPKMRAIAEDMRTHVIDLLNALEAAPRTIVHGDYRLDNIFFGAEGSGQSVCAIDWQISSRGRGIFDVAYFLASCIDPAVRRAEERRLVRMWHEIATGGRRSYGFDDAWTDYRLAVLLCNLYTVIAIGTLDAANERGMALFDAWLMRRFTAIEDLDAGALMPG